jgi:hypothetical protein
MTATKSPAELLRARINTRTRKTLIESGAKIGRLKDSEKKTPSQKRTENLKKKDLKRAGLSSKPVYPTDCHLCPKYPCGETLNDCLERSMVHSCTKCGLKVRHRVDPEIPWTLCPSCAGDA